MRWRYKPCARRITSNSRDPADLLLLALQIRASNAETAIVVNRSLFNAPGVVSQYLLNAYFPF